MRFSQQEKMEIIRLVDGSDLGVTRTLKELGIHKSTFYPWYHAYQQYGFDGLATKPRANKQVWNRIPQEERNRVVETALDHESLSPREVACLITDQHQYYISESSVYRILKEHGLIASPGYIILSASDSFKDKTTRPNEMWQTDFTYFKIIGWGWYYLSTVMDDYSRYILSWELCKTMKAEDAESSIRKALAHTQLHPRQRPKLLSDNGSAYIAQELKDYLETEGIQQVHGRPCHPQTQGKIERYNRSLKNIIKLENYFFPEELENAVSKFVYYYNHHRYHESLNNLKPADVYYGKGHAIIEKRRKIKMRTMRSRRQIYLKSKAIRE